jgi:hypothetical protein
MNIDIEFNPTLKQLKIFKKFVKIRIKDIDDFQFLENGCEDDDIFETAFSKEFLDSIEESKCQYIMRQFDMWDLLYEEQMIDNSYWT